MTTKLGFIGTIIVGGLIGAFGVSLLFAIWTWLFQPKLFGDGQYAMIFLFTSPVGWVPGSIIGSIFAMLNKNIIKPKHPFLTSIGIVIGGVFVIPVPAMAIMLGLFSIIGAFMLIFKL